MSRVLLVLAAAVCALPAEDVLQLRSGEEITGRVRRAADGTYLIRPSGMDAEITIEAARVRSASSRSVAVATDRPAGQPQPERADRGRWSCEALVLSGRLSGSIDSSGSMEHRSDGRLTRLDISDDLAGSVFGVAVRVLRGTSCGGLPILYGATLGAGSGDADLVQAGVVGGIGGTSGWRLLLGVDWNRLSYDRHLEMAPAGAAPADQVDTRVGVAGPGVALEAGWRGRWAGWDLGLLGRVSGMDLSGSHSWTSDGGHYAGSEDLGPSWILAAECGLSAGLSW